MKNTTCILITCALCTMIACTVPTQETPDKPRSGSLSLSWQMAASRTLLPSPFELPAQARISLSSPGLDGIERVLPFGETVRLDSIQPGTWAITVEGIMASGTVGARGSGSVVISAGKESRASITMLYLNTEGKGTARLGISWPADQADLLTWELHKSTGEKLSGTMSASGTLERAGLVAGIYDLALVFSRSIPASGTSVVTARYQESINIFAGQVTAGTIALEAKDFYRVPGKVTGLVVRSEYPGAKLGWTHDSYATGYRIERRETGSGSWKVLASAWANAEFTDAEVLAAGKSYDYRVCAENDFGSGESSGATYWNPHDSALLEGLGISAGSLAFDPGTLEYEISVPMGTGFVTVTPVQTKNAVLQVNGKTVLSGKPSDQIVLSAPFTDIQISVVSENGRNTTFYKVRVNVLGAVSISIVIQSPADLPVVLTGAAAVLKRPDTMEIRSTFAGAESMKWILDGVVKSTTSSIVIDSTALFIGGPHRLTLVVVKDGMQYSGSTTFMVAR